MKFTIETDDWTGAWIFRCIGIVILLDLSLHLYRGLQAAGGSP